MNFHELRGKLVLILIVGLTVRFLRTADALRLRFRIPASPQLTATLAEQVPPELAEFVQKVAPQLEQLGFIAVASVHAPQLTNILSWTQVLFVQRVRGDRASILYLRPMHPALVGRGTPPALAFATESPDGRSVKTETRTVDGPVADVYERHRRDVAAQFGENVVGVVPEPGEELPWLQQRAAIIAKTVAEKSHFALDARGEYFLPPWRRVYRAAWKVMWIFRPHRPRGFDVVSAPTKPVAPRQT